MVKGVLKGPPAVCPKCQRSQMWFKIDPFKIVVDDKAIDCYKYRCKDRKCNKNMSIYYDSFFHGLKKPAHQVLACLYFFLQRFPTAGVADLLVSWDIECVQRFFTKFRSIINEEISNYLLYGDGTQDYDKMIGGPGSIVQVDESAFGKRKYGRGHKVNTKWVFGGIEIEEDEDGRQRGGRFFAIVVPNRNKPTLEKVIQQFIRRGTHIVSDGWGGYTGLEDLEGKEYRHTVVNHSENFVDPDTGAHTNTIEGKWNYLKRTIGRPAFRSDVILQAHLFEEMWRKDNEDDLWEAALVALREFVQN